jgi:hypothetical protein
MPEWLKGADCKSASVSLRWFESISTHHVEFQRLREPKGSLFVVSSIGGGSAMVPLCGESNGFCGKFAENPCDAVGTFNKLVLGLSPSLVIALSMSCVSWSRACSQMSPESVTAPDFVLRAKFGLESHMDGKRGVVNARGSPHRVMS